jgi:spore maturation protein CgeB
MPFEKFLWSSLLRLEREVPRLKAIRLAQGFKQVLERVRVGSFDCLFTREIWDYPLEILESIKSKIPIRIAWLSSSPGRAPYPEIWEKLAYFTHVFLIDREGVALLRERGVNAYYLPFALADYPQVRLRKSQRQGVGFLGTLYPDRMGLLRTLSCHNLAFWAPNFTGGTRIMYPDLIKHYHGEVWGKALLSKMGEMEILVNPVHRAYMKGQEDNVTNFRLFEAIGVETFQIVEEKPAIREIFPKEELEMYSSLEELHEKICFYLKQPDSREKMVENALKRVLNGHLYSHRMKEIIEIVKQ